MNIYVMNVKEKYYLSLIFDINNNNSKNKLFFFTTILTMIFVYFCLVNNKQINIKNHLQKLK